MKTKMEKKNKIEIHKEATEWSKKINIVYEKLLNRSENFERKIIEDAIRFYGPNFQRLPECVESSIKLMKCFLMSSGENNEFWDLRQKNAFNVFVCAMISQKKEDFIVRKVLGCWSDFLTKLPEEQCQKLIHVEKSSKIIKMLFHKLGQSRTYFTQMRLVEILHIYSKYLPDRGLKLMEDVKLNGSSQLYDQLHELFLQITFDDFVETCRRFLNFYNTHLGKKSGIVSILGNLRILNHQTFSRNDVHSDFFDFNSKGLSMSFFLSKKFFVQNHISEEWIYVEIEDFEIDAMEFDDISDPMEKNIQLTIHPEKYFILDSAGKTVHNIPELEKLVIEICDDSGMNKCFRENVYARYKNRTKIHDDATTKGDDESLLSFSTYNTDFCNSSMIEQVKNRNLSINTSFQEKEPTSFKQNRILNIFNSLPQKKDLAKSDISDDCYVMSQKNDKKSEDLYSSIDYGRRLENVAYQLEKNVQKVRPMPEKPPKRSTQHVEPFILINNSIPVVANKRPVKLPQLPRTEAIIKDVYDLHDDGGDSPIVPYKSFISQEREKKKNQLLEISSAMEEITHDTEDFTLDSNENGNYIPIVPKKSSLKKRQVEKLTVPRKSVQPAQKKRSIQTRSKETKNKNNEISPEKVTIILPVSSKTSAKTRKLNVKQMTPPSVIKKTKSHNQNARKAIFYSSSEDNFEVNNNYDCDPYISDMDMDVVIHPQAPSGAIESLMAAKKKREEMKKMQENAKIIKMTKPNVPVKKLFKTAVEMEKKEKEQKPRDPVKEITFKKKSSVEMIENIDPVQIVKNVTFCAIVSPDNKHQYQDVQKVERKRKSKRMADIDEIIQYDMEVNNQQMQKDSPKTNKAINPKKRDLSVEYDNRRFKNMRLSTSSDCQNSTYDCPINYNFDQLKSNKLLSTFISQANNNQNDNDRQNQHYRESVMVQRTTTIQNRVSIDQAPLNEKQIQNHSNFNVEHHDIPSTLRENFKTRVSLASAEARKKLMNLKNVTVDGIDETFKKSLSDGIKEIGNLNKDIKVHCLQHIQLLKQVHHSKKRLMDLKGKSRELVSDASSKLKEALMQLKMSAKHDNKITSKLETELKQKEQECKTSAWQYFMDEFLNNVQEEAIKHYEF